MNQPPNPALITAQLCRDLGPLGGALIDAATHLADMNDLIAIRGDARHEYNELVKVLAYVERAYRDADEKLAAAAFLLQHAEDVPSPLPLKETLPEQVECRPHESGLSIPAHRPTSVRT